MRDRHPGARVCLPALMVVVLAAVLAIAPAGALAAPPRPLPATVTATTTGPEPAEEATTEVMLRLREGPYLNAAVLLVLRRGETVHVAAGPVWGDGLSWAYVLVERDGEAVEGFCASRYLSRYEETPPVTDKDAPVPTTRVRVTAYGGLRLRTGPGLSYEVDRIAPRYSVLNTTGATREADGITWLEVVVGTTSLWGSRDYLQPLTD